MAEPVYRTVIGVARGMIGTMGWDVIVDGAENIPREGPAVIATNHIGYLDFVFSGYAAREQKRLVRFMAKDTVFTHPVSGPLMRGMKHIPVDRAAGAGSYAAAVSALLSRASSAIFVSLITDGPFGVLSVSAPVTREAAVRWRLRANRTATAMLKPRKIAPTPNASRSD